MFTKKDNPASILTAIRISRPVTLLKIEVSRASAEDRNGLLPGVSLPDLFAARLYYPFSHRSNQSKASACIA